MRKLTVILMFLFVLTISATALAWSPAVQGQPEDFKSGNSRGIFIWHDHDGMHVWTTTQGAHHVFSGVIRTDGRFADVSGQRLEAGDYYKRFQDRDTLTFEFNTAGGVDGVNFRVEGGDRLDFELFMDGRRIDRKEVFIGREGWHPRHAEFKLPR